MKDVSHLAQGSIMPTYSKDKPKKFRNDFFVLCNKSWPLHCPSFDFYQGNNTENTGIPVKIHQDTSTSYKFAKG